MLEQTRLNSVISRFEVPIEKGRVALFREAIGEAEPVLEDGQADRVPPTFIGFGLDPEPFDFVELFQRPLGSLLHANQSIEYFKPIHVGDVLKGRKRVAEIFDKKDGQLEFLVLEIEYYNQHADRVGLSRQTLVFVNRQESS